MTITDNLTATVEVLTAEVRTLVVGNRQVTKSVYRQLDAVDPSEVEPFGRVHRDGGGEIDVVGRYVVDGTLVRARLPFTPSWGFADDDQYVRYRARWDQWAALPLIVLAGLR